MEKPTVASLMGLIVDITAARRERSPDALLIEGSAGRCPFPRQGVVSGSDKYRYQRKDGGDGDRGTR